MEDWKMKKDEVLKILQDVNEEIRQRYKARIKGVFGSLAKGEENTGSDVDILVEFEERANLIHFVGLSLFLEEKIHLPVDIVPIDAIREEIKGHVLGEAIYL